ncbi:MAG TPA: DNA/RNA helicase domain-containing protein, partial [Granulicella sp.]
MSSYFRSSLAEFLVTSPSELLAKLTLSYAADGFSEMRTELAQTWWDDLDLLRVTLSRLLDHRHDAKTWSILLEFSIPRKEKRIDAVLLTGQGIVVLECKTALPGPEAIRQVQEYALLLHYFHKPSDRQHIFPIVVTRVEANQELYNAEKEALRQGELHFETLPSFWIAPTQICSWKHLSDLLSSLTYGGGPQISGEDWDSGAYCPTPTIIDAAVALRTGLSVREIALSEAAEHDIAAVTDDIHAIVDRARIEKQHVICFLTGVPGSGKTLVGLSLAHLSESRSDAIHFMSGNGPLVAVLQEVFRRQAMRDGVPAAAAGIQAQTLIENVHVFAKTYTERDPDRAPSNHVIIFDEAQRAWNLAQNLSKFGRNYSEPEMLLKIMQRHPDWACVVALVGGGQEINSGEAGLEEWGKAITESQVNWTVYASPEVLEG